MKTTTKPETIEVTLYISARPPSKYVESEMEQGYGINVNSFDAASVTEEYVSLGETVVEVEVPAGIDVLTGMIDGLKDQQQRIRAEAEVRCNEIEARIQSMLAIEHQPPDE